MRVHHLAPFAPFAPFASFAPFAPFAPFASFASFAPFARIAPFARFASFASLAPLALACSIAACGGSVAPDVASQPGSGPGAGSTSSSSSSLTSVAAACAAPHGASLGVPHTAAAFTSVVARRWFICGYDATSRSGLVSHEGLELTPEGHWYYLKSDGHGGYERDVGADADGPWFVYSSTAHGLVPQSDATVADTVYLHWDDHRGGLDLRTTFESSPLRMKTWNGVDLWFVALDSDGEALRGAEGMSCNVEGVACNADLACTSTDARVDGTCR